jgi:hypothetical protein
MAESYENMELLLEKIQYEKIKLEHLWGFKDRRSVVWSAAWLHSSVACWVSGVVGTENIITSRNSGLNENRLFRYRKMSYILH